MAEQQDKGAPRGSGSFCIPRAAFHALLDAKATAYEVITYLVLARFTDATGRFSVASISAVNRYTGSNKLKGGPVGRAIERLKSIRVKTVKKVSNGLSGRKHEWIEQATDLGPILIDRETWHEQTDEILPDGPIERSRVLYVLPDFDEPIEDRIWFGGNLVTGIGEFKQPLKVLKNLGDVAARLLLAMYAANDMEIWGGVRPVGAVCGPHKRYEPITEDVPLNGGSRLHRAKDHSYIAPVNARFSGESGAGDEAYWQALRALESTGLIYEVVMVLNRNAKKEKFSNGEEYSSIPNDAEPLYELDARSQHGYKPVGEEGIGGATANTAHAIGRGVAVEGGKFDGTYAAIVPTGYPAMIAGIYRLRFRVANPKNAGVSGAWARIRQGNREAFDWVQAVRAANQLPPLTAPWEANKPAAPEKKVSDASPF